MKVLGEDELNLYLNRYSLTLPKEIRKLINGHLYPKVPFDAYICERNRHLVSEDAIDLLSKMLKYDKNLRIRPRDAMKHKYFNPVRDFILKQEAEGLD